MAAHHDDRVITITTGTIVKTILILLFVYLLYILRAIVLDLFTAIVLASAIEPAIRTLMKYKIPRVLGILLVYLAVFSGLFILFYFVLPTLLADVSTLVASLPAYVDTLLHSEFVHQYSSELGVVPPAYSGQAFMTALQGAVNSGFLGNDAFSAAGNVFGGIFSFIIIAVFTFYFAVLETGVDDFLHIFVPKENQGYVVGLWRRSQHKIGLWMQGQLLLGFIIGVLAYLGLTIIGVPNALVLGVLAGCFELIPVFGPTLSAIPAVAIAFASGGLTLGLITIAFFVILQQFEGQLIGPLVVTRVVGVPPLLVVIAVIVGAQLAGVLGVILAVPIAAIIFEFLRDIENGRLKDSVVE